MLKTIIMARNMDKLLFQMFIAFLHSFHDFRHLGNIPVQSGFALRFRARASFFSGWGSQGQQARCPFAVSIHGLYDKMVFGRSFNPRHHCCTQRYRSCKNLTRKIPHCSRKSSALRLRFFHTLTPVLQFSVSKLSTQTPIAQKRLTFFQLSLRSFVGYSIFYILLSVKYEIGSIPYLTFHMT